LPAPSQVPSVPQPGAPVSAHWASGSWPDGTLLQVPALPDSAHDLQSPVQAVPQQTPCWQKPDAQSVAAPQAAPSGCRPQLPAVQTFPVVQSLLVPQAVRQLPEVPHTNGLHVCMLPGAQVPTPSQRPASVAVETAQVGGAHCSPAA
jgi:hypothetical protein